MALFLTHESVSDNTDFYVIEEDIRMGGNQRDLARQKNQKKVADQKRGKKDDGLTVEQRKQRDAEILREKQRKKEEAAAAAVANSAKSK